MKKTLLLFAALFCLSYNAQTGPSFSITNTSGTNYITCTNTSVNYVATSTANLTYLWVSSNATLSGSSVSITLPGNYSVTATDTLNNISIIMFSVLINTVLPVSTVSPNVQSITCASSTAQFIIIVSPTPTITGIPAPNLIHTFTSPTGAPYILNQNSPFIFQANSPGTYTYMILNTTNGCSVVKNFTVTSTSGFPTYSITSPQNFTLGCTTKSFAVINIVNAQTTPTPGGPITYTLISPYTSSVIPPGVLSPTSTYTLTTPGIFTVVVRDNNNNCDSRTSFSVLQNTTAPNISAMVPKQILDCSTSQTTLNGSSNTPNVSYQWFYIGTPGSVSGYSIIVNSNSTMPTNTFINNYTLTATDNNNTCKSTSVIPMYQNLFPPKATISSGGINALTCNTPTIVLTNVSISGIPISTGFPTSQPVIGLLWTGPTPQTPSLNISTYIASVAGVYTLQVKDLNNACTSQTTITIADNVIYPQINLAPSFFLPCPGIVSLTSSVTGSSASYTYFWQAPSTASISNPNGQSILTDSPGYYTLTVTNIITGCASTQTTVVQACVGIEDLKQNPFSIFVFPNPSNGNVSISSKNLGTNCIVEVYNSLGVLAKADTLNSELITLNLQDVSNGIYFLQVRDSNKLIYSSKLIKQ